MKLKELADLRWGISIPKKMLVSSKNAGVMYFQVLSAADLQNSASYYVTQKDLKKSNHIQNKTFLFYGDYLLYKKDGMFTLLRYDNVSGQTIPNNDILVIVPEIHILTDYLTNAKNRIYFLSQINRFLDLTGNDFLSNVGEIEVTTEDIMELENSNIAEQIGIRQPINKADLPFRITQKPLPIDKILKRIKYEELLLDAEFQRRPGLWDIPTKSRLIESMIIRLPIPAFYFDGTNDDKWLIIDGLQRISAINDFVHGKFALTNLDYLPELEDLLFVDLDRTQQRNIEEYEIFAYILEKGTPKNVVYKIFKSINTSALKLELQEIRHAINPGRPAEFLKEISENEWFQNELSLSDRQKDRMEDREVALRFVAFQITNYSEYKPNIGDFLDSAMTCIYDVPKFRQIALMTELRSIFEIINKIFGVQAYSRNLIENNRIFRHNNIIFELLTYAVSILTNEKRKILLERSSDYNSVIKNYFLKKDGRFWESDSAYSQDGLKKRFQEIEILTKNFVK